MHCYSKAVLDEHTILLYDSWQRLLVHCYSKAVLDEHTLLLYDSWQRLLVHVTSVPYVTS